MQSNIKSDAYDVTISSCDGVEMVKQPAYVNDELGNSSVVLEFRMCDSYEFGKIRFKVSPSANTNISLKEVEYIEQNIYCYHDSNSDYVSTVCFENLSAYSEKLQNHINNLNRQGECIENDNNSVKASKSLNSITDYSLTVAGYINWTDGAGGVHPAQDIMVAVYTVNGSSRSIVGLINTSSVGAYSCSIPTDGSSKNIMVTVFSQGTNVLIKDTSIVNA